MEIHEIETTRIEPNRRFVCDSSSIEALSQSIRLHGQLEPIQVWLADRTFRILDGEKRWRACRRLGLSHMRVEIIQESGEAKPVA